MQKLPNTDGTRRRVVSALSTPMAARQSEAAIVSPKAPREHRLVVNPAAPAANASPSTGAIFVSAEDAATSGQVLMDNHEPIQHEDLQPVVEASTWSPTRERMWSNNPLQEQATPSLGSASLPLVPAADAEQCMPVRGPAAPWQCSVSRMANASRTCSRVYFRRRVQARVAAPVETDAPEGISNTVPSTPALLTPTSATRRASFMAKITRKTENSVDTARHKAKGSDSDTCCSSTS